MKLHGSDNNKEELGSYEHKSLIKSHNLSQNQTQTKITAQSKTTQPAIN